MSLRVLSPLRGTVRGPVFLAFLSGAVAGAWAGVTSQSMGSMYTTLFLAGLLLAVVVLAIVGWAFATLTARSEASRTLAAFAVTAPVAFGLAYVLAPPYRSPDAPFIHKGTVSVHLDPPEGLSWRDDATCRVEHLSTAASSVWMPDTSVGDRWVAVLVGLDAVPRVSKVTIAFTSPTTGNADYVATPGGGLGSAEVSADGLRGSAAFTAWRVPIPGRPPAAGNDPIAGAVEWSCGS